MGIVMPPLPPSVDAWLKQYQGPYGIYNETRPNPPRPEFTSEQVARGCRRHTEGKAVDAIGRLFPHCESD